MTSMECLWLLMLWGGSQQNCNAEHKTFIKFDNCHLRSFSLKITLGRLNFHAKSDKPIIGVCADVIGSLTNQERSRSWPSQNVNKQFSSNKKSVKRSRENRRKYKDFKVLEVLHYALVTHASNRWGCEGHSFQRTRRSFLTNMYRENIDFCWTLQKLTFKGKA